MLGAYVFTYGIVKVTKASFIDMCCATNWTTDEISNKINHIKKVFKWVGMVDDEVVKIKAVIERKKIEYKKQADELKVSHYNFIKYKQTDRYRRLYESDKRVCQKLKFELDRLTNMKESDLQKEAADNLLYTGHGIISMLFPMNFEYTCNNKISPDGKPVKITRGTMISGCLNKQALGSSSGSLIHHLYKDYGAVVSCNFITYYQRFMNALLEHHGQSAGIEDCIPRNSITIQSEIDRCFLQAKTIMETEMDLDMREVKVQAALNDATNAGEIITRKSLDPNNNFVKMIVSGAKGQLFNTVQITSAVGQQNIEGARIPKNCGGRSLPCYNKTSGHQHSPDVLPDDPNDLSQLTRMFQSRGFITSNFYQGLTPQEFFFLGTGGREGLIDTSVKTSKCGYITRRLLKMMEDVKIGYNQMVINAKGSIVQFTYGDDNLNAAHLIKTEKFGTQVSDISHIIDTLNNDFEWNQLSD